MSYLHEILAERVDAWRARHYACDAFPAIAEILNHAFTDSEGHELRYLRRAQFRALETYWYLRLQEDTARIPDLYRRLFEKSSERRKAMGLKGEEIADLIEDHGWDPLYDRIRTDAAFVRKHQLESLRETLTLDYPSYILALAMGAGKTILMGTIIATEFAMAQEYPDGPFVQNALVFAPGTTIIESLRELADIPYASILPPRMYGTFAASLKLTFTRDGDKSLPIIDRSSWNVIVTNTEKIRIQKRPRRKQGLQMSLALGEDHEAEIANDRLRAIASLPHLAVFSDEAHHTYGQKLLGKWEKDKECGKEVFKEQGIKKVRKTVDFLAEETNLVVVVNTTGTPYFERQPLRDVVIWYGLGEGIRDGVLKELANNIQVFDMAEDQTPALIDRIVKDFVDDYWDVRLADGSPARLALYFPQVDTMEELRRDVESALATCGIDTACVLAVHGKSGKEVRADFHRVANDPASPHRVILLVNMGTEGWNCPSLFACGLVRQLKTSNNFVLQAATRCLRQVPGNTRPARVYVSKGNRPILEKQLAETYGTSLQELGHDQAERVEKQIVLRQSELPPLLIRKHVLRYQRNTDPTATKPLVLTVPDTPYEVVGHMQTWTIAEPRDGRVRLSRTDGGEDELHIDPPLYSVYGATAELGANYHLDHGEVLTALRAAYGADGNIPQHHMPALGEQIEAQRADYVPHEEFIEESLALVKPDGFDRHIASGEPVYTARVSFAKHREHLYRTADNLPDADLSRAKSFHYEGYNFDSNPEAEYLERVLHLLKQHPDDIDGVWFTGGLTDPKKTELFAEYLGEDGRWHRYTPDFVIRRRDGKHLIVEIKSDQYRQAVDTDLDRHAQGQAPLSKEGRKAVALQRWQELNPDALHYQVIFAGETLAADALDRTREFLQTKQDLPTPTA